ncbi:MAG TPA: PKD domain-containing protein, partial [Tepidisphaeraceae bacterium]|nr:PKD domain-containing protein [Tepidisphaeraceae bacterium]
RDRNYLYDGSDESMNNFNIAFSPTGSFENGADDWNPAPAPVNITFVQPSVYGGSGFPTEKQGHAFVTQSGSTFSSGPDSNAKLIEEWVLNPDGTRRVSSPTEPANPRPLVKYEGSGKETAAAIAPGPDGLYFSTLYPTNPVEPWDPGAKIYRVAYVGLADFTADVTDGDAPLTVRFTDRSVVPGAALTYHWEFGDGATSHERNPVHVYAANGSYSVKLTVTGANGAAEILKSDYVLVGPPVGLPSEREPNDTLDSANNAENNGQPFTGPRFQLSLRGQINPGTDTDFFNLGAMQAGDVITANLAGSGSRQGSLADPLVRLFRSNGGSPVEVASDNDSGPGPDARVRFTVTAADTYFAAADSNNDGTGTYDLGVWLENAGAAPTAGGAFRQETTGDNDSAATADGANSSWRAVNTLSTTNGSIATSADVDNFRFQFNAGDVVTVISDSTSSAQTRVRIRNAGNNILAEDDRGGDAINDAGLFSFFVPATGTYYVEVRSASNTGAYSLNVYRSNALPAALPPAAPSAGEDAFESEVASLLSAT